MKDHSLHFMSEEEGEGRRKRRGGGGEEEDEEGEGEEEINKNVTFTTQTSGGKEEYQNQHGGRENSKTFKRGKKVKLLSQNSEDFGVVNMMVACSNQTEKEHLQPFETFIDVKSVFDSVFREKLMATTRDQEFLPLIYTLYSNTGIKIPTETIKSMNNKMDVLACLPLGQIMKNQKVIPGRISGQVFAAMKAVGLLIVQILITNGEKLNSFFEEIEHVIGRKLEATKTEHTMKFHSSNCSKPYKHQRYAFLLQETLVPLPTQSSLHMFTHPLYFEADPLRNLKVANKRVMYLRQKTVEG
ncbi:hypothetical protein L345_05367, partial [Ophiophagus hannah]